MKVFIPIRSTEFLSENVRKSIEVQGGQIILVENEPLSTLPRRASEWQARDEIVNMSKLLTDRFVVTNDANGWHRFADNFACMEAALQLDPGLGAVGLWRQPQAPAKIPDNFPVYLSCVMWRREILEAIPKLTGNCDPASCCCHYYGQAVRAMGYKYTFLDSLQRIQEIY